MRLQKLRVKPKPLLFTGNFVVCEDRDELGRLLAARFERAAQTTCHNNVFASDRTHSGFYKEGKENDDLAALIRKKIYIQLDEVLGVPDPQHPQLLYNRIKRELLDPVLHPEKLRLLFDPAADPDKAAAEMERLIESVGGIDLAVLGVGDNAHIGYNEPGTPFGKLSHAVTLDQTTRRQIADLWGDLDTTPKQAITLGLGTLSKSNHIFISFSGENRAQALEHFRFGDITEQVPVTNFRRFPEKVTVFADKAAMGL